MDLNKGKFLGRNYGGTRRLLLRLEGKSLQEIANIEGVSAGCVWKSIKDEKAYRVRVLNKEFEPVFEDISLLMALEQRLGG